MPVPADTLPAAALVWDGGQVPACDRSALLRQNVSVYLGRDPFQDDAPLTIRIALRRASEADALIADVSEVDEQGHVIGVRSVRGSRCETLDEPLTLVVALMLDETTSNSQQPPESAPPPRKPNQPETEPEAERASDSELTSEVADEQSREMQPGHAFVSLGIGTSLGKLPFVNYGPQLQAVFKPRRFWGLEFSAGALGGSRVDLPSSGTINFVLLELGAALCPLESLHDGILLRGCGGLAVGWLRAESHDLVPTRRRTEVVVSPELHLQLAHSIGSNFLLGGGLGAAFPIRPNQYVYRDPDGVRRAAFQMSIPSFTLGLFLARRFH